MTLSRWRRVATGIAAGVIVLCAALIGGSFRSDPSGVSVASEVRPATVIPIDIDGATADDAGDVDGVTEDDSEADDAAAIDPVRVIPEDATADEPSVDNTPGTNDEAAASDADADADADGPSDEVLADDAASDEAASADAASDEAASDEAASDEAASDEAASDEAASDEAASDEAASDEAASDDAASADDSADEAAPADEPAATEEPAPAESTPPAPTAPLTAGDDALGTGGGVDDAECAIDRLVIYAGARVGGVAGSIRNVLAQAGFGGGCPTPVTVLASNCPLQFAGVLGAGSGYDPNKSFVASSDSVDRETLAAVMGTVGYTGSEIDILDFGFVNPDRPGEQWIAIFIPPSFTGWENLASRAGLPTTAGALCAPSGELAR